MHHVCWVHDAGFGEPTITMRHLAAFRSMQQQAIIIHNGHTRAYRPSGGVGYNGL